GVDLLLVGFPEVATGLAVNPSRGTPRSRQDRVGRAAYPLVPVQQTIQVGEPVRGMVARRGRQGHLLLGRHSQAHTSVLRLSSRLTSTVARLPSFALCRAFPGADYCEGSAPPAAVVAR